MFTAIQDFLYDSHLTKQLFAIILLAVYLIEMRQLCPLATEGIFLKKLKYVPLKNLSTKSIKKKTENKFILQMPLCVCVKSYINAHHYINKSTIIITYYVLK